MQYTKGFAVGELLSCSAKKVGKEAAGRGAELIAPAIKAALFVTSPSAHFRYCTNPFPNLWSAVPSRVAFYLTKWKRKVLLCKSDTERVREVTIIAAPCTHWGEAPLRFKSEIEC